MKFIKILQFLCGSEENKKVNRSVLWSMVSTISTIILLWFAYIQLRNFSETTSADLTLKIKNDLYTPENIRLLTLFDDSLLIFKSDSDEFVWFELDTNYYDKIHGKVPLGVIPKTYNILEVDELLQNFEDLSFYEEKGQIKIDYIYNQYAYYIEMLWENQQLTNYIKWQRSQIHNGYCYKSLEAMYFSIKSISDAQP